MYISLTLNLSFFYYLHPINDNLFIFKENRFIFDLLTNINQKRLTLQMEQMQFEKFTMKFPEENVGPNEASQAVLKLNQTSHV